MAAPDCCDWRLLKQFLRTNLAPLFFDILIGLLASEQIVCSQTGLIVFSIMEKLARNSFCRSFKVKGKSQVVVSANTATCSLDYYKFSFKANKYDHTKTLSQ